MCLCFIVLATLYNFWFFIFVEVSLRHRMWSVLVNVLCSVQAWEEMFCSCWLKYSTDVSYLQLVDGAFELIYILIDFLPTETINYWWKCAKTLNYNIKFIYFSLQFCQSFASCTLTVIKHIHIKNSYVFLVNWSLCCYVITPLYPW